MPTITEQAAQRYAAAVIDVLASEFPDVADQSQGRLGWIARNDVTRQASSPDHWFELIVTYTREWRLHPIGAGLDPWRVELVCHKDRVTDTDIRLSDQINAQLRAIKLEG
jgi:hypothetical protein